MKSYFSRAFLADSVAVESDFAVTCGALRSVYQPRHGAPQVIRDHWMFGKKELEDYFATAKALFEEKLNAFYALKRKATLEEQRILQRLLNALVEAQEVLQSAGDDTTSRKR